MVNSSRNGPQEGFIPESQDPLALILAVDIGIINTCTSNYSIASSKIRFGY